MTRSAVAISLVLMPSEALAEVMDKVSTPWEPRRLVPLVIVTAICAGAAWRSGWTRTPAALVVAVVWAAAVFAFDLGCVALSLVFTVLILAGRRQRRGEAKRCRQKRGARSGNATTFD